MDPRFLCPPTGCQSCRFCEPDKDRITGAKMMCTFNAQPGPWTKHYFGLTAADVTGHGPMNTHLGITCCRYEQKTA